MTSAPCRLRQGPAKLTRLQMDWKSYIRYRIRHARTEARLTQVQLAEAIGVDNLTVSKFERGKILPSVETVEKVARVTHLPLDWFFRSPVHPTSYQEMVVNGGELWQHLNRLSQVVAEAGSYLQQIEQMLPAGLVREMETRYTTVPQQPHFRPAGSNDKDRRPEV